MVHVISDRWTQADNSLRQSSCKVKHVHVEKGFVLSLSFSIKRFIYLSSNYSSTIYL